MTNSVSVIIPTYNETEAIGEVLEELRREFADCEVIVVDDGSTDDSAAIAVANGARLIKHEKNLGYAAAMVTGIRAARGEIIVTMNADYTYPASYIPKLVELVNSGYEMAIGRRMLDSKNMPRLNKLGNWGLSRLISLLSGGSVSDVQSGLRAFRKSLLDELGVRSRNFEFETQLTARAMLNGCRIAEIPIEYRLRVGKTKLHPVRDGYGMLKSIFRFVREASSPSIRFFFLIPGVASSLAAVILAAATVIYFLSLEPSIYWLSAALTIIFAMVGIQLIGMAVAFNIILARVRRVNGQVRRNATWHTETESSLRESSRNG